MSELPARIMSIFDRIAATAAIKSTEIVANAESQLIQDRAKHIIKIMEDHITQHFAHEIIRLTSLSMLVKTLKVTQNDAEIITQVTNGEIAYFLHCCVIQLFKDPSLPNYRLTFKNADVRKRDMVPTIIASRQLLIDTVTKLMQQSDRQSSPLIINNMTKLINDTPYTIDTETMECITTFPAAIAHNTKTGFKCTRNDMKLFVSEEMLEHTKHLHKQLTELAKRELPVDLATSQLAEKTKQLVAIMSKNRELAERCAQLEQKLTHQ